MIVLIHFLRFFHDFVFPPSILSHFPLAFLHNFSPFFQLDVLWAHSVTPPLVLHRPPLRARLRARFVGNCILRSRRDQNKRAMYSRIMCFQYGQSWPPSGPQLSSEWRMPLPSRISERRYDRPDVFHWPAHG